jgi:hypothetical protein
MDETELKKEGNYMNKWIFTDPVEKWTWRLAFIAGSLALVGVALAMAFPGAVNMAAGAGVVGLALSVLALWMRHDKPEGE